MQIPPASPVEYAFSAAAWCRYVPIHDASFEEYIGDLAGQAESPQFASGYHKGAKEAPKPVAGGLDTCILHMLLGPRQAPEVADRHVRADTGKPKRKRVRDARQQSLNKLAQIRYR